ncbi:MAG: chemotaxis response regulator protein-glutamate methylesterase [Rubrimonas sp.]|uniref:protein-glutamate methylesterase/protein-glutamine glutaminase n=1 Tax=Rubrimonas sp. TaxID=2036015 RepID=UPI002FDDE817
MSSAHRPNPAAGRAPVRVLVVDDSAVVRAALSDVIAGDPGLSLMGTARDPFEALEKMRAETPDVMVLDVELPRMDGLTFLRRIMAQQPIPVVICSSHTQKGSEAMLRALEAGAVEVIGKPAMSSMTALRDSGARIRDAIRGAACARLGNTRRALGDGPTQRATAVAPKLTADAVLPPARESGHDRAIARMPRTEPVICIGASTGGTEALREVLVGLPADAPGVVVVQHMPAGFTAAFARRLDGCCAIEVKEAEDGDAVRRGRALIAPGERHLALKRTGRGYGVSVLDGAPVSRHKPSVDVLFRSAAQVAGPNAVAAILTGMGDDGATGMLEMRQMGAATIAQDEATCVVFGMPKEAIARGGADTVLPLERIAAALIRAAARPR